MSFVFRPGQRQALHLLISLAGGTGSGKSLSSLRIAKGIAGPTGRIAFIDTENGRGLMYADDFPMDYGELSEPFTPARYIEALKAGAKTGAAVIILDSLSHIWTGTGGILEQQEDILQRMAGDDFKKREACRMSSWIKPKTDHKKFVTALLQIPAHVICCFRASPKIEMVRKDGGGWEVRAKESLAGAQGWIPDAEKSLPFEMTASFLLLAERPGVPIPIKLPQPLRSIFPLDQPITESCGEQLATWARGGIAALPTSTPAVDWIARIDAAQTLADLEGVGTALAAGKGALSAPQLKKARAAWDARRKTLKKAGTAAPVRDGEIQWND